MAVKYALGRVPKKISHISVVCLGLHLARMELRLGIAHFFRAFPNAQMSALEGMADDDMEQVTYFLAPPKNKRCLIECA